MKPHRLVLLVTLLAFLWPGVGSTQEKLGKVNFPTSCSPTAQQEFNRAVALLHSFYFDAAGKAFAAIAEKDPSCAMAYWGIAMNLRGPVGNPFAGAPSPQALKEGWAAIEKAKASGAKSQRERDWIAALELFYKDAETVDHRTRSVAYEKAMEQLVQRYPADREAAVFYALTLNVTALPTDKTYDQQLKAAAILEKVFAEQPEHPGVAHYLIHSYDYPPIAGRGLPAARRYASIAPSAPHAQHMPSHIFTRRGFWQESIASNRASAAAATDHLNHLHAMDYLAYAYLQGAQDREAKRVLDEVRALGKVKIEHFVSAYALAAIPSRYALERGQWAEAATLALYPSEFPWSRFPQSEAILVFARALGAARSGNVTAAKDDLSKLQSFRDALASAKQGYWSEQVEIQWRIVSAWIARAEGKNEEAVRLLRAAAAAEDATEKHPVTPGPILPARELLGELLLELGEPKQALAAFEHSMTAEPNRFKGTYGAARAAERSGDMVKAKAYYAKLAEITKNADTERPELREAKAFLAKQ
jgi:hypothetical protein